jgi:hypothetical protein
MTFSITIMRAPGRAASRQLKAKRDEIETIRGAPADTPTFRVPTGRVAAV